MEEDGANMWIPDTHTHGWIVWTEVFCYKPANLVAIRTIICWESVGISRRDGILDRLRCRLRCVPRDDREWHAFHVPGFQAMCTWRYERVCTIGTYCHNAWMLILNPLPILRALLKRFIRVAAACSATCGKWQHPFESIPHNKTTNGKRLPFPVSPEVMLSLRFNVPLKVAFRGTLNSIIRINSIHSYNAVWWMKGVTGRLDLKPLLESSLFIKGDSGCWEGYLVIEWVLLSNAFTKVTLCCWGASCSKMPTPQENCEYWTFWTGVNIQLDCPPEARMIRYWIIDGNISTGFAYGRIVC